MTPSNPSNSQPLIYRIADALGVFHLVAPVNHTHSQAEIDGLADALAAKQDALTFDTTPTEGSTNPVTSGGVKAALDAKRQIRQDDPETSDHAIVAATASDGDVYITLSVREGDNIKYVHITPDNMDNLIRALLTPDTAPTANSTKLVTSGGVAAALTRSVSVMTSNIDVEGLPNGKIIPVSYLNTSNEAKNLYDIFSFDNVTTQVKRLAINTEDVEIPSSGRAFAFIMKKTSESALDSMTTLHVWYQGAGRIVIR